MMALDTNVIVRFLVRDDEKQAQLVYRRLQAAEVNRERLFIPLLVLLEVIWVLESAYDMPRADILNAIESLRHMSILEFEGDTAVERLLSSAKRTTADLPDLLIAFAAQAAGCAGVLTFDKKATQSPGFELLK